MLLSALLLALPVPAVAAPGDLDPSFDGDGKVLTDFRSFEGVNALVVQPDGKLVAAGGGVADFFLARYKRDGSLDASFGSVGLVETKFGDGGFSSASAVVLQPDGKLVAAGEAFGFPDTADFVLARYNANGGLDGASAPGVS